tara:strand:+ start:77 stop:319 length:243 start_codon:yes stop_codon:yes gene_type:complete
MATLPKDFLIADKETADNIAKGIPGAKVIEIPSLEGGSSDWQVIYPKGWKDTKKKSKPTKVATAKHGGLAKRGYGVARRG